MLIDRTAIERELSAVRAQQQQAANVLQQAVGAEKALNAMLQILDTEIVEKTDDPCQPGGFTGEPDFKGQPFSSGEAALEDMPVCSTADCDASKPLSGSMTAEQIVRKTAAQMGVDFILKPLGSTHEAHVESTEIEHAYSNGATAP